MDPLPLGRCCDKNPAKPNAQCIRWAIVLCSHCDRGVCAEHSQVHQHEIQTRAHRLNNRTNDVRQLLHSFTQQQMLVNIQQQIDQWTRQCKDEIDLKQARMSVQLLKVIDKLNVDEFRQEQLIDTDRHIGQPLMDLLRVPNDIQARHLVPLEEELERIQRKIQEMTARIHITDDGQLKVDSAIVLIDEPSYLTRFTARLRIPPLYKHVLPDCPGAMAGSIFDHDYLLVFQEKPVSSLFCFNNDKYVSQISLDDSFVYDICWSSSTQVFFVAAQYHLYEFCPFHSRLSKPYQLSESTNNLWTIACDSTDLFVIYEPNMTMHKRDVRKPFEKKTEWSRQEIMREKGDRGIGSMRIDEQKRTLALSIKQIDGRWRVDLFETTSMQRLRCGTSFGAFSLACDRWYCMITPLLNQHNHWLVQNSTSELPFQLVLLNERAEMIDHIDHDGCNVTLVGRDKIAFLDSSTVRVYQR